jgi:hypothetical protein
MDPKDSISNFIALWVYCIIRRQFLLVESPAWTAIQRDRSKRPECRAVSIGYGGRLARDGRMLVVRPIHDNWCHGLVTGAAIAPAFEAWIAAGAYKRTAPTG